MSLYPQSPRPTFAHPFRSNRPEISAGPAWAPQSRPLTNFGLAEADVTYRGKTWAQIMVLYNFFESVGGAAGRFTYVDFNGIGVPGGSDPGVPWIGLFIAKGDGTTTGWDLPTFGIQASPFPAVYENGVSKTVEFYTDSPDPGIAYHIHVGGGTDGVDTIFATTAAADTVIVTIDATCRRAFRRAKFLNAKNPFSWNAQTSYSQDTVTILEVRK